MTIWQAVLLGLVQGLGEFLPISSSAHLVLLPWIFNWTDPGLTFDIALHAGTLLALIAYFWRDWLKLIQGGLKGLATLEGKLFWFIVIASLPGAGIGFLLEHKAETVFRSPALIAVMLIIMGLLLLLADKKAAHKTDLAHLSFANSFLIGFSQALAIIPGVSRSGVTMTAGLLAGLTREATARFSFLLSAPIIFGASAVKIPALLSRPEQINAPFIAGILVSAVSGFASIKLLLTYLQKNDFTPFVWYRFGLGAFVLVLFLMR
jgi:undecaprenyl-diphosphatase